MVTRPDTSSNAMRTIKLPRRLTSIALTVGIACFCLTIWRYWTFSEITMEDDYEIKISLQELELLRKGRDSDMDEDMEKMIKQKLKDINRGQLQEEDLFAPPEVTPPPLFTKLNSWNSPLFEQVIGTDIYYRSPTFDDRVKHMELIRIMFIARDQRQPDLYCHVMMADGTKMSTRLVTQANLRVGAKDGGVLQGEVICPWTPSQSPSSVTLSVSQSNVTNRWHAIQYHAFKSPDDLTYGVCLNARSLQNADATSVMHWFDIHKLMGVDKVVLHQSNLSAADSELLGKYKGSSFIETIPWEMPFKVRDNGQYLADLDCFYRSMDTFSFLLYLDIGQYIVPGQYKTFEDLMEYLDLYPAALPAFKMKLRCQREELEKIIFEGSKLDLQKTFNLQGTMREESQNSIIAVVRPQLVKNFDEISNKTEHLPSEIGCIIQYGKNSCIEM